MRYLFIVLFLLMCQTACAESYLIYDNSSLEIVSLSSQDDAVLPEGCTKKVLTDDMEDIPLSYQPRYYKYVNNRFVVNVQKLSAEENAKIIAEETAAEQKLIDEKLKDLAIDALKAGGVNLTHIKKGE